jgi:D-glycero-alpha-D-manno-heptose-7-phosphate kinase
VLSFAIDKFCYINIRELPPFFNHRYRVAYSKVEMTQDIDEINHPAVREAFRKFTPNLSLELHHHGDLPAQSGVGSSSAFAVGLIHSLLALRGETVSLENLANQAIELEQKDLLETVGSQDQIACSLGDMNFIEFGKGDRWLATPLHLPASYSAEIEDRMVLLFTGISRSSSDVSKMLLENLESKASMMARTHELAVECSEIFRSEGDMSQIGPMLMESWELKKKMNPASVTPLLEEFLERALVAGALGGKILGAGGGGFCLFWVEPGERDTFIKKMSPAVYVPIRISPEGSTRIL